MLHHGIARFYLSVSGLSAIWWLSRPGLPPGDPEAAIVFSVWVTGGLALAWLTLSVGFWMIRLGSGRVTSDAPLAFPGSRRIAQGLVAAGMLATAACGQSSSAPVLTYVGEAPTTIPETPPETISIPSTTTTVPLVAQVPHGVEKPAETRPAQAPPEVQIDATPPTHTVEAGEHLWSIAAERVGRDASIDRVTDYWLALVEANRGQLASSDPNLIFPGEVLTMPGFSPRPPRTGDTQHPNPPTGVS